MLYLKMQQLQFENDTWRRLLCFMMEENIRMKDRLTEILKNSFDNRLLEEMEGFQNKFIKQDERIRLLRNEVVELEQLLNREIFKNDDTLEKVDRKLDNFRNSILNAEQHFGNLQLSFNNYLSVNLQLK